MEDISSAGIPQPVSEIVILRNIFSVHAVRRMDGREEASLLRTASRAFLNRFRSACFSLTGSMSMEGRSGLISEENSISVSMMDEAKDKDKTFK